MAFCTNCGSKNDDASGFCVVCGCPLAPQQNAQPVPIIYPTPPELQPKMKKSASTGRRLTVAILVILLAAGLAAGGVFVWFHVIADGDTDSSDASQIPETSPSSLAEQFFRLYFDEGDGEAIAALCNQDALEAFCDKKLSRIAKAITSQSDGFVAELDASFGNDWSLRCETGSEKTLSASKLKKLQAQYDELDLGLTIDEAASVTLTVTVEVNGDKEDSSKITVTAVKIDGLWLLDALALSEFLS